MKEVNDQSFMLTQSLEKKNIGIGQIKDWNLSKKKISEKSCSIMKRFYCVDKTAVVAFFISFSTIKIPASLEQNTGDYALEYKLKHAHVIGRFKKGKQCF